MNKQAKSHGWRLPLVMAVSLCLLAATSFLVGAQTPEGAVSLGVSPQVLDLTANPGDKITNTFRLTNASDEAVEIEVVPKNFTPRGEEGAVDLTVDKTSYSLAEWIEVNPDSVSIPGKSTEDFTVNIDVPDSAEPGSHFGSVVFTTIPPEQEGSGAAVSQEIAPVILVRVSGDVEEMAEIAEFKSTSSFYGIQDSVDFVSRIENTGSVHFKPVGKIEIKDMFGNQVANLDLDRRNVLPDSIRQVITTWQKDGLKFGRYTATLTLVFGESDKIKTATTSFYYFPYQIILPVILVIGLVVYVIKKYRARIKQAFDVLRGKDSDK